MLSRTLRSARAAGPATRSLTSSATPGVASLLARSRAVVEGANERQSDQLGDMMAKRWLGAAVQQAGTDADRVGPGEPGGSGRPYLRR